MQLSCCSAAEMMKYSLLPFLVGALIVAAAIGDDCVIENNVDYIGTAVNNGLDDTQPDPYTCQAFCR